MDPQAAIGSLDAKVEEMGEEITLRRNTGTRDTPLDVVIQAWVRLHDPRATVEGLTQDETEVIVSPTEMTARRWCWPPVVGDFAVIRGALQRVERVDGVHLGGKLVRLNLGVAG